MHEDERDSVELRPASLLAIAFMHRLTREQCTGRLNALETRYCSNFSRGFSLDGRQRKDLVEQVLDPCVTCFRTKVMDCEVDPRDPNHPNESAASSNCGTLIGNDGSLDC